MIAARLSEVPTASLSAEELLGPLNTFEQKYAPKTLYFAGNRELLDKPKVSIVGSRQVSEAGLKRTARLARELVEGGIVVVSGLAAGVDRRAHEVAMAKGRTIAVLGTPLDEVSPKAR